MVHKVTVLDPMKSTHLYIIKVYAKYLAMTDEK